MSASLCLLPCLLPFIVFFVVPCVCPSASPCLCLRLSPSFACAVAHFLCRFLSLRTQALPDGQLQQQLRVVQHREQAEHHHRGAQGPAQAKTVTRSASLLSHCLSVPLSVSLSLLIRSVCASLCPCLLLCLCACVSLILCVCRRSQAEARQEAGDAQRQPDGLRQKSAPRRLAPLGCVHRRRGTQQTVHLSVLLAPASAGSRHCPSLCFCCLPLCVCLLPSVCLCRASCGSVSSSAEHTTTTNDNNTKAIDISRSCDLGSRAFPLSDFSFSRISIVWSLLPASPASCLRKCVLRLTRHC